MRIVDRVASIGDRNASQLPPLYDAIEPEALDALVKSAGPGSTLSVEFQYVGRHVTVTAGGDFTVA